MVSPKTGGVPQPHPATAWAVSSREEGVSGSVTLPSHDGSGVPDEGKLSYCLILGDGCVGAILGLGLFSSSSLAVQGLASGGAVFGPCGAPPQLQLHTLLDFPRLPPASFLGRKTYSMSDLYRIKRAMKGYLPEICSI